MNEEDEKIIRELSELLNCHPLPTNNEVLGFITANFINKHSLKEKLGEMKVNAEYDSNNDCVVCERSFMYCRCRVYNQTLQEIADEFSL